MFETFETSESVNCPSNVERHNLTFDITISIKGGALFPGSSTINQIERIMNTINKPSKSDIESIGSHYAASVL